jgi:hypothetical protein
LKTSYSSDFDGKIRVENQNQLNRLHNRASFNNFCKDLDLNGRVDYDFMWLAIFIIEPKLHHHEKI